jgi:hypothetical protein
MNEKRIIENNKNIAKFMNWSYLPYSEQSKYFNYKPGYYKNGIAVVNMFESSEYLCRKHRDLKYHTSFDWLMPVVCKLLESEQITSDLFRNWNNINELYSTVVELIKQV